MFNVDASGRYESGCWGWLYLYIYRIGIYEPEMRDIDEYYVLSVVLTYILQVN